MEAVRNVESEVRELIRRTGLDPARDTREVDRLVRDAVADYDERSLHGGLPALPDIEDAVKSVLDAVAGFGPLQPYFDDPTVEEIWINEPSKVFIARGGVAELTTTILTRRRGARPGGADAQDVGPPGRPVDPVRRRHAARRVAAARRHPGHHPRPLARQHPQVRRPRRPPRRPGRARHPDRPGRAVPRGRRRSRAQHPGRRRHPGRQDHAAQLPQCGHPVRASGSSRARRSSS